MMQNLYNEMTELLRKQAPDFFANDKLNKNKVTDAAYSYDSILLKVLLNNASLKKQFFIEVEEIQVFKQREFLMFLNNKSFLQDSYTRFKNEIGLQDEEGRYFRENTDVVLVWPHKDCILEGGQTKEDQSREEVFYNETLAPDEIDRLLDTKALTNFTLYDKTGKKELKANTELNLREQNLIIRGNNLLALHSLKARKDIVGKVKLIYIDPPYNTGNDGFRYNDKFNHSSWLTFMKNRLEIAKQLLREDGAIYVNLDFNEVHYAKILMDEVFGNDNFQREIIWRIGWLSGYKTADKNFIRNHDSILFYSKNSKKLDFKKRYIENKDFKKLVKLDKIKDKLTEMGLSKAKQEELVEFINYGSRPERYPIEDVWNGNEYDDLNSIAIVSFSGETVSKMLGVPELKGQKSEKLLERIINSHTSEGELVLDFHLGTGTTAAVAHKMGRKYIGIEQMDYIQTTAIERLKKVIEGEQSGISKQNAWTGGGSFVYCELKEFNQKYFNEIKSAKKAKDLCKIWETMEAEAFLRIEIDKDKFTEDSFNQLKLEEQKKLLMEALDKNHLYVNLSEMEDEEHKMTKDEIELNKKFYNIS
jgi:adenine-specific DNA-methyltransferase